MRKILIAAAFLFSNGFTAETVEEMRAAIQENETLQTKATALCDAKRAYDDALNDYKKYRGDHQHTPLSKESAPFVVNADKLADFQPDPNAQKLVSDSDREKQTATNTTKQTSNDHRQELQKRIIILQNRVNAAVNTFKAAQNEWKQANETRSTAGASNTQGTRAVTAGVDENALRDKMRAAREVMEIAELDLQRAQQDMENLKANEPQADAKPEPPKPVQQHIIMTFQLKDGTKVPAFSSVQAGDVYIVKTEKGIQKIKKDDVLQIDREE